MRKTIAILDVFIKAQIIKTGGEIMDVISRDMIPLLISAKDAKQYLPEARFHDLRHTYAAASISYGDDIKMVQHNLGHYSASFTYDTYCHIVERMRLQSADRMEEYYHNISAQNE